MTRQIARFLVVGGCGFLCDITVFQIGMFLTDQPIPSRFVSAATAVTLTWALNRRFVFGTAGQADKRAEYLRYLAVQAVGLGLNLGTFLVLVTSVRFFADEPLLALCAGAGFAIVTNFLGSKLWAFRYTANTG